MRNFIGGLAALTVAGFAGSASAALISGTGDAQNDAAVAGGTVIDFEGVAISSANAFTVGDLTITGLGGTGTLRVDNSFAGDYNGRDTRYIDNNAGQTHQIVLEFANAVSAFTFNWGAADVAWSMDIYNGATLIDTVGLDPVFASNAGDYYGYSSASITRAVLTTGDQNFQDWVFVDNVSFGGDGGGVVPEPGTWALMILGFGLAGAGLRRRTVVAA